MIQAAGPSVFALATDRFDLSAKLFRNSSRLSATYLSASSKALCCMLTLLRNDHLTLGSGGLGRYQVREVDGVGQLALASVGPAVAERLVEAADRVVAVGDVEHVVGGPAVVKPVGPDPGHAAPGHPLDLVVGELLPLG